MGKWAAYHRQGQARGPHRVGSPVCGLGLAESELGPK